MSKSEIKGGYLMTEKVKRDRKSLNDYIANIQTNKEAYSLFMQKAEKIGMIEKSPQRKQQFIYYDTFIKPQLSIGSTQFDTPHKQKA